MFVSTVSNVIFFTPFKISNLNCQYAKLIVKYIKTGTSSNCVESLSGYSTDDEFSTEDLYISPITHPITFGQFKLPYNEKLHIFLPETYKNIPQQDLIINCLSSCHGGRRSRKHYRRRNRGSQDVEHGFEDSDSSISTKDSSIEYYPREWGKFFLSFILMWLGLFCTTASVIYVHDHIPPRDIYKPLPDIFFSIVEETPWALPGSEIAIAISLISVLLFILFHKYNTILFRRCFLILAVCYFMRGIAMTITLLPLSSKYYKCSPQVKNPTLHLYFQRFLSMVSGFGFSMFGKHICCGEFLYSGHTAILFLCWLFIQEYTRKTRFWFIHYFYLIVAIVGVCLLLASHTHYTIDCVVGYYGTTRVFWIYHHMVNNVGCRTWGQHNYFCRTWWFWIFYWFEKNIPGPVPNMFGWPFPRPTRWKKYCR